MKGILFTFLYSIHALKNRYYESAKNRLANLKCYFIDETFKFIRILCLSVRTAARNLTLQPKNCKLIPFRGPV